MGEEIAVWFKSKEGAFQRGGDGNGAIKIANKSKLTLSNSRVHGECKIANSSENIS